MTAIAWGDKGRPCARPFFVLSAGMLQTHPLKSISLRRIPATSVRRWPVRIKRWTSEPKNVIDTSVLHGAYCPIASLVVTALQRS